MNTVKLNLTGLKTLQRQLPELEAQHAEVGLFADTAGRSADRGRIQDNPSLGFVHEATDMEFGSVLRGRKQRSFLRMPLMTNLGGALKDINWAEKLRSSGAKKTLGLLGVVGEEVVQEAFATGGPGWPALEAETIRRKGSSAILIESAQMRKAIASRVV